MIEIFENTDICKLAEDCNTNQAVMVAIKDLWERLKFHEKILERVKEEINDHAEIMKEFIGEK